MNTIPPFAPEPTDKLMLRFPAAMADTYDLKQVESGQQINPALQPKHRFDFTSGIRMIASVELAPSREVHLSFGVHELHQAEWIARGQAAFNEECRRIFTGLQAAKLIPPGPTDTFVTRRATHYWFRL